MLDLNSLAPAGRHLYARSLAGALASGLSPVQAESIAKDALQEAGLIRIAKSAEATRVMRRLELVKSKPELADEIGEDNAAAVRFLEHYNARRSSNPKARPGEIHSKLAAEFPRLASAYRAHVSAQRESEPFAAWWPTLARGQSKPARATLAVMRWELAKLGEPPASVALRPRVPSSRRSGIAQRQQRE